MSGARIAPHDDQCSICDREIRAGVDRVVGIERGWAHEECADDDLALVAAAAGAAAATVIFFG